MVRYTGTTHLPRKDLTMKIKSHQEEQADKDAIKARKSRKYSYQPSGLDIVDPKTSLRTGDIVVKVQPYGCPKNGTMGQCYVGSPNTGKFIGMVSLHSLEPVKR